MLREAVLKTGEMFKDHDPCEKDFELWRKIAGYMDGETALVAEHFNQKGTYILIGLRNAEKDKVLAYMMEQDSETGSYIHDWDSFKAVWESGEYSCDESFCIDEKYLILNEERKG